MLFVDARQVTGKGSPLRNPLEYSVKSAVSMATFLLKNRNQVGLVSYNDEVKAVFPSIGEKQIQTITSALVGTYARGNIPLMTALEMALPHLHPHCTVMVISRGDDELLKLMKDTGFPGLAAHQTIHQQLTKQASELLEKLKAGKMVPTVSLASFLKDWLVNHIQGQDKQYGKHIASLQTAGAR